MKLIYCPTCGDIIRLTYVDKSCDCGFIHGRYVTGLVAEISKEAIPLGIDNISFLEALEFRPDIGSGWNFEAFVIPRNCPSVRVLCND